MPIMKNNILFLVCLLLLITSCKNREATDKDLERQNIYSQDSSEENRDDTNDDNVEIYEDVAHTDPTALEFRHVFDFTYKNRVGVGRVSILHDSINSLVLYEPEDDMTDFIIIDNEGTVYSFYTGEHDSKVVYQSKLTFTEDNPKKEYPITKELVSVHDLNVSYDLNLTSMGMPTYNFKGYRVNYLLSRDSLDFYITEQIKINSEHLHAFGQIINVDWNYPINKAFLPGIISNKQLIGKLIYGSEEIELLSYSPTTYFAQISDYKFIVNESSDDWEVKPLPLLKLLDSQ